MEGTHQDHEDTLIQEELHHLNRTNPETIPPTHKGHSVFLSHLVPPQPHSDPNKHRFSHYADKQLQHLVVS